MGDYAKGIAVITMRNQTITAPGIPVELKQMALKATDMLKRAMKAFMVDDTETAKNISKEDNQVDLLYARTYDKLIKIVFSDPWDIPEINRLFWVAHNLERLADRVTNICERTLFLVTGDHVELQN
jgi:phosphate transport system protein